jgi:hypothetical protein
MNKKIQLSIAALALTLAAAAASVRAAREVVPSRTGETAKAVWMPGTDLRQIVVNPSGPEADPYYQHHIAPTAAAQDAWLPGVDLRQVAVNPSGPEADLYLEHVPAK